jgi:hypothetical protein
MARIGVQVLLSRLGKISWLPVVNKRFCKLPFPQSFNQNTIIIRGFNWTYRMTKHTQKIVYDPAPYRVIYIELNSRISIESSPIMSWLKRPIVESRCRQYIIKYGFRRAIPHMLIEIMNSLV